LSGAGRRSTPRLILAPSDGGEGQSVAWLIPDSLSRLSSSSSLVSLFSHLSRLVASPGVFFFLMAKFRTVATAKKNPVQRLQRIFLEKELQSRHILRKKKV